MLLQQKNSVQFSSSVVSDSLQPYGLEHTRLPVHHELLELSKTHVHLWVMPPNHLILCHLLLFPPSIFLSIRVFTSASALPIRWPKYWSFSLSISPSNEYSGLISFRIDWFDLLAVQGLSRVFSNTTVQKLYSSVISFLYGPIPTSIHDYWKIKIFN